MSPTFALKTSAIYEQNPTPERVAHFLNGLPLLPEDNFLIVDRTDAPSQGISVSYMQTHPHDEPVYEGDFVVEYRDGLTGRHYESFVRADAVVELFTSYLGNDNLWRELTVWRDISHWFEDLRALMPLEELADSYFPEGEWERTMEEKQQRDEAFWDQVEEE